MSAGAREVEFKLRTASALAPAAVESAMIAAADGFSAGPPKVAVHEDLYLDDSDHSLLRSGIGLRVRRDRAGAVVCLKTRGRAAGGLHDRREWQAPWARSEPPVRADELPRQIADLVEPLVRGRPLQPLVQLEVQREERRLFAADHPIADLAFDRVTARRRDRETSFCELEVEVLETPESCASIAATLRTQLPVTPVDDDKLAHSLQSLGARLPPRDDDPGHDDIAVKAAAGADSFAYGNFVTSRLRAQLTRVAAAEAAVRSDGGADDVHELRVALRRARTMLRACRRAWPTELAARAEATLAAAAHQLAALRAHDATTARLATVVAALELPMGARPGTDDIETATTRAAMLNRTQQHLRSPAHVMGMAEVEELADLGSMLQDVAKRPASDFASRLRKAARAARRRIRALAAEPSPADLHGLRLSLKRLRILAEEATAASGVQLRRSAHRRLLSALARLGEASDQAGLIEALPGILRQTAASGIAGWLGAALASEHLAQARVAAAAVRAAQHVDRRRVWRAIKDVAPRD